MLRLYSLCLFQMLTWADSIYHSILNDLNAYKLDFIESLEFDLGSFVQFFSSIFKFNRMLLHAKNTA